MSSDLLSEYFNLDSDLDLDLEDENDENDKIDISSIIDKKVTFTSNSLNIYSSILLISEKMFESNIKSYSEFHS